MAVSHKTTISFSLVSIPVALYTATVDTDIRFNQLHEADGKRIKYKKTCSHCGKEVAASDIVRGYEYEKDKYITVTDEEIEMAKREKDRSVNILHFANLKHISPIYYDKTYHAVPEKGGEKAFELLRLSLMETQKIAIGKTVMGTRESLVAIIPREDGILVQTMLFEENVKELPKGYEVPSVSEKELQMARELIKSMDTPFSPTDYKDEYKEVLRDLIGMKISGQKIKKNNERTPVINGLMEALKESLAEQKGKTSKPKTKKKKTTA